MTGCHIAQDLAPVPALVIKQTLTAVLHCFPDAADVRKKRAQDHVV